LERRISEIYLKQKYIAYYTNPKTAVTLSQNKPDNLNSPRSTTEIGNLPTKKIPGPVVSLVISFKHLRKNSTNLT